MLKLSEWIEEILINNEIYCIGEENNVNSEGLTVSIEYEFCSPLGEDVIISIDYDGTDEGFIKEFCNYAEDFNSEEHAEMWIECRGENGVSDSIKDLLEDAEWQKEMLLKVANDLEEVNNENIDEKEVLSSEEKLEKIKKILSEKEGIADNQEFGLTYSQIINYLDEIEEIVKG